MASQTMGRLRSLLRTIGTATAPPSYATRYASPSAATLMRTGSQGGRALVPTDQQVYYWASVSTNAAIIRGFHSVIQTGPPKFTTSEGYCKIQKKFLAAGSSPGGWKIYSVCKKVVSAPTTRLIQTIKSIMKSLESLLEFLFARAKGAYKVIVLILEALFARVKNAYLDALLILEEGLSARMISDLLSYLLWGISVCMCYMFGGTPLEPPFEKDAEDPVARDALVEARKLIAGNERLYHELLAVTEILKDLRGELQDRLKDAALKDGRLIEMERRLAQMEALFKELKEEQDDAARKYERFLKMEQRLGPA